MKIALTCPASLPATQFGGILFLCVDIAKELSNYQHDVIIFTTDMDFANNPTTFNKKLPRLENFQNFKINRSHVWFSIGLFFVNPSIYFQLKKDNPDIIHAIGVRSFQAYVAAVVAKKNKIHLVISDQGGLTTHPNLQKNNLIRKFLYKIQMPMIRFIINQATKIVVANEYEKKIFSQLCDESKIEIVRNGINLDIINSQSIDFKKKYKIDKEYVLFIGRFDKIKGIDVLLEAINIIKNKHEISKIKFVIMGVDFGFEHEMMKLIKKLGIQNYLVIIKNPPREDVIEAYRETKFLVLPSRWELSPLTPLEGFAFKKPVISTKAHGIPYTIKDKENCLLVASETPNELANAIIELLNNDKKCLAYGESGYNLVQNICNSKKMALNILKIYQEILKR